MIKIKKFNFLNKRGQVTLFVILALILVVGIILFFVIRNASPGSDDNIRGEGINPESYLVNCMKDTIEEEVRSLGYTGGSLDNDLKISFEFEDEPNREISYLCYTPETYRACNIIEPLLMNSLEEKIIDRLNEDSLVEKCWSSLISNYESEGYEVTESYDDFSLDLFPGELRIELEDSKIDLIKGDDSINIRDIILEFPTKLYDNVYVAIEIANQQSEHGSFNELGYMEFYPDADITFTYAEGDTKIYTIKNKETDEVFRFAIRSLVSSGDI
jgi:hypothetical protein